MRTCIAPPGIFRYGIHKPSYTVANLRQNTRLAELGRSADGIPVDNRRNFPSGEVRVDGADWIFEIPNPLPFKGSTYIDKEWADASAADLSRIRLPQPPQVSLSTTLRHAGASSGLLAALPRPLLLALATTSTDPQDLTLLAHSCCRLLFADDRPVGLEYEKIGHGQRPAINDHALYEAVANNPHLPDDYKVAMVLRPGAQGGSEIVGEWQKPGGSHVYEYLRRNSYIAGGHYAANMAEDAVRYRIDALSGDDMRGLRHLYYQRSYVRLAAQIGLPLPSTEGMLEEEELERLRQALAAALAGAAGQATLWGWNFGFDYAPSSYRLHASHQQVHQQYAMVPAEVDCYHEGCSEGQGAMAAFSSGDMVAEVIAQYRQACGGDFFADYRRAIAGNSRLDGRRDLPADLVVWKDERVMLFVPKAQTSQWELQLMTLPDGEGRIAGNIVECDSLRRRSLDLGLLIAQRVLAGLGAAMVTSIEYGKRLGAENGQPLLYALLPRLPESPGAFSEMQLRYINGHYPEDFAAACRARLPEEGGYSF